MRCRMQAAILVHIINTTVVLIVDLQKVHRLLARPTAQCVVLEVAVALDGRVDKEEFQELLGMVLRLLLWVVVVVLVLLEYQIIRMEL